MPTFRKPKFSFSFDVAKEIDFLQQHKSKREIPEKSEDQLLIASWNIANLGLQIRWREHYTLLAEIVSWFDIIAIQEVNNNLSGLRALESELPSHYDLIFSDTGGNNERSVFIYNSRAIKQLELVGELGIPPKEHKYIKIKGFKSKFTGFDRNPFLCSFQWQNTILMLITVHSFSGGKTKKNLERRALEAYAIGRYADLRNKSKHAFSKNIIALGDFNIPKVEKGDIVYEALKKRGLKLPEHSAKVYSNISNDKMYDQITFLPSIKSKIKAQGIFDFDNAIFPELYENESKANFKAYLRYYISDHRLLWMQLKF
ncbi:MAG: endonuclease/exonuclease/phosphatase family protein [Flavobacteriaceae bacterium]|nr:endonuclease/exonuclease/phosphatase family protein [Flavobacteriaceae bacterium]